MLYLLDQNQVLQLAGQAVAQHASRGRSSPDLLWCSPEPGRCWYRPELPANPDARRLPDVAMERTYGRAGAGVTAGGRRTMVGAGVSVLAITLLAAPPPCHGVTSTPSPSRDKTAGESTWLERQRTRPMPRSIGRRSGRSGAAPCAHLMERKR